MQPVEIDIGTAVAKRDGGESINRSTYTVDTEHTLTSRSLLQFYRTYAKRSGNSRGASKSAVKLTRDVSVPNADGTGNIVAPLIIEVSISCPIGAEATACAKTALLGAELMAHATTSGSVVAELINKLDI